ncbi:hypothetical protein E2C01_073903 [Portunus trituberculatus]|uniref:Uncharacterized protein n=1 Tax=Portunus trituberculatus TaxID=210409 RepID=A0A5B7IEW9_PORTR|nr:hypothetical protein [Portunus trituberculatus]
MPLTALRLRPSLALAWVYLQHHHYNHCHYYHHYYHYCSTHPFSPLTHTRPFPLTPPPGRSIIMWAVLPPASIRPPLQDSHLKLQCSVWVGGTTQAEVRRAH